MNRIDKRLNSAYSFTGSGKANYFINWGGRMTKQYVVSVVFNTGYFETYARVKRVKISKEELEIVQKRYTIKIDLKKVNYYVVHFPGGYCLKLSVRRYEAELLTVHKKAITEERGFLTCHENG